jgi:hypothetical protein
MASEQTEYPAIPSSSASREEGVGLQCWRANHHTVGYFFCQTLGSYHFVGCIEQVSSIWVLVWFERMGSSAGYLFFFPYFSASSTVRLPLTSAASYQTSFPIYW